MGLLQPYQYRRIEAWLNPESDPTDKGFQVLQGLYAIGSGGLVGQGLGESIQKLGFLPESQNDMIFAIICEELGPVSYTHLEDRIEPIPGNDLHISLDVNIQKYAEQLAYQVLEKKNAKKVSIIVMNPQNGELMAMVNVPEFNLNDPFTLNQNLRSQSLQEMAAANQGATGAGKQELLNQMWRNTCINDTYEPGSTFKIITAAAGLESGVVKLTDQFSCPGFRVVEDRKIRCHKVGGHGAETFLQGAMNSCNPVFIDVGQRLGVDGYYKYFTQFGLKGKTGIDLPGEAATIMHKKENMGLVELATVSFGQSFQLSLIHISWPGQSGWDTTLRQRIMRTGRRQSLWRTETIR